MPGGVTPARPGQAAHVAAAPASPSHARGCCLGACTPGGSLHTSHSATWGGVDSVCECGCVRVRGERGMGCRGGHRHNKSMCTGARVCSKGAATSFHNHLGPPTQPPTCSWVRCCPAELPAAQTGPPPHYHRAQPQQQRQHHHLQQHLLAPCPAPPAPCFPHHQHQHHSAAAAACWAPVCTQ